MQRVRPGPRGASPSVPPLLAEALHHHRLGHLAEAEQLYRQHLAVKPREADSLHLLGMVAYQTGRHELAVEMVGKAIAINPGVAMYHANLGAALKALDRLKEAAASYRRTRALMPDYPDLDYNLGNVLKDQGQLDEAIDCFRTAIARKPDMADAHLSLGTALHLRGQAAEAVACFQLAAELQPDLADAQNNLAMAALARGDMAAGWRQYEWRWKTPQLLLANRDCRQPRWRGEAGEGHTLLIHAEQGFGDTLQFCRYATLAAERGLRVVLEVPLPLVRLLQRLPGVDQVVAAGQPLPDFDLHCPMLSLPLALGTTLDSIPGAAGYLRADPAQVAAWRTRLAEMTGPGPLVGLVWAGNARGHSAALAATDRRRSLAPERLAPLFDVHGPQFFSLQKDGPKAPPAWPLTDFMPEITDFADTAALIANLDLVVSVDTAVAHLAAGLGKPVWLLSRFDSCWRWLTGRRDSPWYPTLLLYRQPHPGDWEPVLAAVVRDLRDLALAGAAD